MARQFIPIADLTSFDIKLVGNAPERVSLGDDMGARTRNARDDGRQ